MNDLNVNKVGTNPEIKMIDLAAAKPEEALNSVFNESESAAPLPGDEIGHNMFDKISGKFNGKDFEMKRYNNLFSSDYSMKGRYDKEEIRVEVSDEAFSSKLNYTGTIGKNNIKMKSENKSLIGNARVYSGTYKGKEFNLEYGNDGLFNKSLVGKYGNETINIVKKDKFFDGESIESNKISDDFAPVAALILGNEEGIVIEKKNQENDD